MKKLSLREMTSLKPNSIIVISRTATLIRKISSVGFYTTSIFIDRQRNYCSYYSYAQDEGLDVYVPDTLEELTMLELSL